MLRPALSTSRERGTSPPGNRAVTSPYYGVGAPASAAGAASADAASGSGDSGDGVELPQAYAVTRETNNSAMIFKLFILQSYSPCDSTYFRCQKQHPDSLGPIENGAARA
jgi:hypothetical protein